MAMEFKNENNRIYAEGDSGELLAEITFPYVEPAIVNIDHTFVDPSLRGQGVADLLIRALVDYLAKSSLQAVASCPYALKWFERHEEARVKYIASR